MQSLEDVNEQWSLFTQNYVHTCCSCRNGLCLGLQDGSIYLHNLKYDETVVKFSQDWGAITSISFRTDGKNGWHWVIINNFFLSTCVIISIFQSVSLYLFTSFLRILPKSHSDIYICTILSTYSHSFSILFCINLGPPVMVSGSNTGHIAVWNLEERKLASQIRTAHGQGVQGCAD